MLELPERKQLNLPDTDLFPESIYIFNTAVSLEFPDHHHRKAQLCYTEGGATFLDFRDTSYFLPSRHFTFVPAGEEHNIWHKIGPERIYTFYIPVAVLPDQDFYKQIGIYPVMPLLIEMFRYAGKWDGDVFQGTFPFDFVKTLVHLLADSKQESLPFSLPTTTNKKIQEILFYIQHNLDQKLSLETIGKRFGMSARTLSRQFNEHLSTTFFQYLKMARIIRAIEMLLQDELTVSEIAFATGYESISAFSNTFVSLVGTRPSDFRERNR